MDLLWFQLFDFKRAHRGKRWAKISKCSRGGGKPMIAGGYSAWHKVSVVKWFWNFERFRRKRSLYGFGSKMHDPFLPFSYLHIPVKGKQLTRSVRMMKKLCWLETDEATSEPEGSGPPLKISVNQWGDLDCGGGQWERVSVIQYWGWRLSQENSTRQLRSCHP